MKIKQKLNNMDNIYNLSRAAGESGIAGLGRNKLYQILKLLGIVNKSNIPEQKYIADGFLTTPKSKNKSGDWSIRSNVTLVVGYEGLHFIKNKALEYLKDNPMPKFSHRRKVVPGTGN